MSDKKFYQYIYEVENWVDEFAIAFLSFGLIAVMINTLFFAPGNVGFLSLGSIIYEWIVMIALMVIARELWLINRNFRHYVAEQGE